MLSSKVMPKAFDLEGEHRPVLPRAGRVPTTLFTLLGRFPEGLDAISRGVFRFRCLRLSPQLDLAHVAEAQWTVCFMA